MTDNDMEGGSMTDHDMWRAAIIALARERFHREGRCEIDDEPTVSETDDNGAYVSAWVWVDFAGTDLDERTEA